MQIFEKIIGELKNYIKDNDAIYDTNQNYNGAGAFLKAIDVVEQAAEEFATYTNVGSKGWISCSEQLPEPFENVLISTNEGGRAIGHRCPNQAYGRYYDLHGSAIDNVVAWQPLPEPYPKGE